MKINSHARNGVRISQYSKFILLGALAFLCLAIVSLCVFSNLNALATDNIAFADDDVRAVGGSGDSVRYVPSSYLYEDNLIPKNYCLNWDYNYTGNSSSWVTLFNIDNVVCDFTGNASLVNNVATLGSDGYFRIRFTFNDTIGNGVSGGSWRIAFYSIQSGISNIRVDYSLIANSVYAGNNNLSTPSNSFHQLGLSPGGYYLSSGSWFSLNFTGNVGDTVSLNWFYFVNAEYFRGYVSPDYKYYGYNQGYEDGLNAGGGSDDGYDTGYDDGYADGYAEGYDLGRGSIYTGTFSDYTILSDYNSIGISNNALNISDSSELLNSAVVYTNFTINGYTINYQKIDIVGSDDYTGNYTLTLTGTTGYSGYKVSSFNINENSLYKFMFNPEDTFNICISVPEGGGTYLYWTYALQTDGYINGVPYMDLTPYIKPWSSYVSCDIYIYNPVVRLLGANVEPLVLHNRTPIYGIVSNNLIIDNSNGNYNQGFDNGYLEGKNVGYIQGYEAHVIDGGTSSFLGLFSAVIDAPVKVISDALNFELLGYNLKNFLFALLSIALVLFVIRLFV